MLTMLVKSRAPAAVVASLLLIAVSGPAVLGQTDETPDRAETATHPLSLDEAIARALDKNEAIQIERASLGSAVAAVAGAEGAYEPVLGFETGWRQATLPVNSAFSGAPVGEPAPTAESAELGATVRKLLPSGAEVLLRAAGARTESDASFDLLSPAYDTRLGVELRQPLLRDRRIDPARLTLRVAAADRDRALASLRREVLETVSEVERAYWALVAARRAVAVREEAVALADEQLAETAIRIESGASPETEIAQPRAELERRRGELLASREAVARAENTLKLLILSDTDTALWLAPLAPVEEVEIQPLEVDAAAAMERALDARPEVEGAEAFVERRRAETVFARDGVRPALDLVVSYDRFGLAGSRNAAGSAIPGLPSEVPPGLEGSLGSSLGELADGDFDDARVALVFEVPLGNSTARAAAETARHAQRQAAAGVSRVRKAIRAEVLDAVAALETAGGRIEAAQSARAAAEIQLDAERERFAVGLSTNFVVLTRQNDLSSARLDEIAALTDYRMARTEMARATGSLLEDRGIEVTDSVTEDLSWQSE